MPSRNRTLDSEVLGRNVGLPVNDTRLEVFVDFEKETDARVRPERKKLPCTVWPAPADWPRGRGGGGDAGRFFPTPGGLTLKICVSVAMQR